MALCRAPQASHMLGGFAGRVFRRFVEHKVELVKMEAEADVELQCKFHDSAYLDEQLVSVACLGRFDTASALPMLSHAVEERVQRLRYHAEINDDKKLTEEEIIARIRFQAEYSGLEFVGDAEFVRKYGARSCQKHNESRSEASVGGRNCIFRLFSQKIPEEA
eukprot:272723_1